MYCRWNSIPALQSRWYIIIINIAGIIIIIIIYNHALIRVTFIQFTDCVYIVESQQFVVPITSEVESLTLFLT